MKKLFTILVLATLHLVSTGTYTHIYSMDKVDLDFGILGVNPNTPEFSFSSGEDTSRESATVSSSESDSESSSNSYSESGSESEELPELESTTSASYFATHFIPLTGKDVLDFLNKHNITGDRARDFLNINLICILAHFRKFELNKIKIAAQALIEAGARINDFIVDVPQLNSAQGLSAFYVALLTGSCELVEFLIVLGARVNNANQNGRTALMAAACTQQRQDNQILPLLKILIAHGARVNSLSHKKDTALGYACSAQARESILYLITHGASVLKLTEKNAAVVKNYIPNHLERLALIGHVDLLVRIDSTTLAQDILTTQAILYAAAQGRVAMIKILLHYLQQNLQRKGLDFALAIALIETALSHVKKLVDNHPGCFTQDELKNYILIIGELKNFLAEFQQAREPFTYSQATSRISALELPILL